MRTLNMTIGYFLLMSWTPVMAENMECGMHMISDDQANGETMHEIRQKCGEPHDVEGDDWYYRKEDGATYRLHFNDSGQLESISLQ